MLFLESLVRFPEEDGLSLKSSNFLKTIWILFRSYIGLWAKPLCVGTLPITDDTKSFQIINTNIS